MSKLVMYKTPKTDDIEQGKWRKTTCLTRAELFTNLHGAKSNPIKRCDSHKMSKQCGYTTSGSPLYCDDVK